MSTTKSRNLAVFFLGDPEVQCHNMERVIFEITADPELAGEKPFADITSRSCFLNEEEVLIMFGSIFRIMSVDHEASGISIVKIELCTNDSKAFTTILEHLKNEYGGGYGETDLICVGQVIRRMGCSSTAEQYFHRYLSSLGNEAAHLSTCYYNLAVVANDKGDYHSSLELHRKSLNIKIQILKPNDPELAESYNGLGNVYRQMCQYKNAYECYKKAFTIWKNIFGENHQKVAVTYQNIGIIYVQEKNYSKSLEYHTKALFIRQSQLPHNHPELADSHDHISTVYCSLGLYNDGLKHLKETLRIFRTSLPPKHPSIARAYKDLGYIYEKKHDLKNAISNYKQARTIYNEALPATHVTIVELDKTILRIESKLKHKSSK
ncbi:unnamed protein product [Rotaria sp. Silwood2]|nr:unnamed protein product [Rotaria sp. Silwood2]